MVHFIMDYETIRSKLASSEKDVTVFGEELRACRHNLADYTISEWILIGVVLLFSVASVSIAIWQRRLSDREEQLRLTMEVLPNENELYEQAMEEMAAEEEEEDEEAPQQQQQQRSSEKEDVAEKDEKD